MSTDGSPGIPFSQFAQAFEASGVAGLQGVARGPFLVEIATQDPSGLPEGARATPQSDQATVQFNEDVLLELKRVRSHSETRVFSIPPNAVLGRGSACELQFPRSESLTKRHARFRPLAGGAWAVEDLGSTNGTFVEQRRLSTGESASLDGFTLIQFGDCRFVFAEAEDMQALLSPVTTRGKIPIPNMVAELQSLGSRRFLMRHSHPYLLVVLQDERGDHESDTSQRKPNAAFPLIGESALTLGRSRRADITLTAPSVSKKHAEITRDGGYWHIADSGSSYGTVLNAQQLPAGERKRLTDWDALIFGGAVHGLYLKPRSLLQYLTEN